MATILFRPQWVTHSRSHHQNIIMASRTATNKLLKLCITGFLLGNPPIMRPVWRGHNSSVHWHVVIINDNQNRNHSSGHFSVVSRHHEGVILDLSQSAMLWQLGITTSRHHHLTMRSAACIVPVHCINFLHAKPWIRGYIDIHGCYSLVKIDYAPICACNDNRQIWLHNTSISRSHDVTDQL